MKNEKLIKDKKILNKKKLCKAFFLMRLSGDDYVGDYNRIWNFPALVKYFTPEKKRQ